MVDTKLNSTIRSWLRKCENRGLQFASVQTRFSIFDRVAIVSKTSNFIWIEYPEGNLQKGYTIQTERIALRDIAPNGLRYYKD